MKVFLTERDRQLLELLAKARWLTTRQIQRNYFAHCSLNACQKRLRKLSNAGLLGAARPSRTEQQLWRIGAEGARILRSCGHEVSSVPKRHPSNLDHFLGINDLRLWFLYNFPEGSRFLAEWELKRGRRLDVIPDALACVNDGEASVLLALEVDC